MSIDIYYVYIDSYSIYIELGIVYIGNLVFPDGKAEGDLAVRCRDFCLYWCGKWRRELVELDQEWRRWKGKGTRMMKLLRAEWHTQQVNPDHRLRMVFPEWEHLATKWVGEDWRKTFS